MAEVIQNELDQETGFRKLTKTVAMDRLYDIALNPKKIRAGDTVATFTTLNQVNMGKVEGSSDMVIPAGSRASSGLTLQFKAGGGTVGEKYKLEFTCTMVSNDVISDTVVMEVVDG